MSEYITIVKCTDKLENALQYDRDIAHFLFENGFICKDVYEDVLNPKSMLSVGDKAGLLVSGIRKKVELNPQNYMKLIKHLRRDEKYSDILFIMESVYSDTQQSASSYAEPTSISIEKKGPSGVFVCVFVCVYVPMYNYMYVCICRYNYYGYKGRTCICEAEYMYIITVRKNEFLELIVIL